MTDQPPSPIKKKSWLERDGDPVARFINDIRYRRVGLYTLRWNDTMKRYVQLYERVPRPKLPETALAVDGRKGEYMEILDNPMTFPTDGTVTATDYYLYMVNTDIDRALASTTKVSDRFDLKKLAILGVIAVAVVVYLAVVVF